jgi:cation transporter-like permease
VFGVVVVTEVVRTCSLSPFLSLSLFLLGVSMGISTTLDHIEVDPDTLEVIDRYKNDGRRLC